MCLAPSPGPSDSEPLQPQLAQSRVWEVLPTWVLVLMLVLITLSLLPILHFCFVYGYSVPSAEPKWKEKILNPSKSHLFQLGGAGLRLPDSTLAFTSRSLLHKGSWDSHVPELEGMYSVHCGDSEVSPLTTENPKEAYDLPSGPHMTLATSEPKKQPPSPSPSLSPPSGKPKSQASVFDFNGPYIGPPHSCSLPVIWGQLMSPHEGRSRKTLPPGSLEYLCLPAGGQVQLVQLAQATGQSQAMDVDGVPSPGAEGSFSLGSGEGPAPPLPGAIVGALPTGAGSPKDSVMASGYVTTADLALTPPTRAPSVSLLPPVGLPFHQSPSLCPGLASISPGTPAPLQTTPGFDSYVGLPVTMCQSPKSLSPPVAASPVLSPGDPQAHEAPESTNLKGWLLVLQQNFLCTQKRALW
ncbi:LOW QUALITY PROTEIN: cytokine receptor common subunit beta-like [Dugong dugon]